MTNFLTGFRANRLLCDLSAGIGDRVRVGNSHIDIVRSMIKVSHYVGCLHACNPCSYRETINGSNDLVPND